MIPFVEILARDRQVIGHLRLGRYLTNRQKHFLGFDTWTCDGFHRVGRRLRVGHGVRPKQQTLAPILRVLADFQVDGGVTQIKVRPDKGV